MEIIKGCLLAMKNGELGWDEKKPISCLLAVTWGNPPFYQKFVDKIAEIPPVYEVRSYDDWVLCFGKMAKTSGVWDGIYKGYDNPIEVPYRLTPEQVSVAIGD